MNAQEGYWRKDSHQEEVYSCRLNLCRGEATALEKVYGHAVDSDEFNNTLSLAERTEPVELDTCRTGAIRAAIRLTLQAVPRTIMNGTYTPPQCDC
jgi:hypothetical protein